MRGGGWHKHNVWECGESPGVRTPCSGEKDLGVRFREYSVNGRKRKSRVVVENIGRVQRIRKLKKIKNWRKLPEEGRWSELM